MPNRSGDLVTVLTLEDFEFRTGLRNASAATRQFATDITSAGNGASAGFGRAIGQMGFAAQDFASVLSMGGKNALGRALMSTMNNVQMLGMAFGPWGLAITAVGGALASILIPKLLEGSDAGETFAESIERSEKALDKLLQKETAGIGFGQSLRELEAHGGVKELNSAKDKNLDDIEKLDHEIQRRQTELRRNIERAIPLGGLTGTKWNRAKPLFGKNDELLQEFEITDPKLIGEKESQAIAEQDKKLQDLRDTRARLGRRGEALDALGPKAVENDEFENRRKQNERRHDELERLREKTMTPLEKLQDQLGKLQDLDVMMPGNEGLIGKGMEQLFAEFEKSLPKEQVSKKLAPAALKGSSEAISIINRAMVQNQKDNIPNQQLDQAKKLVDLAKQQLDEQKKKREPELQPVQLSGS